MPNDGETNLLGLHRRSNGLPAGKSIYLDLIYSSSLIQVKRNVRRAVLDHKSMPEDGEADLHGLNRCCNDLPAGQGAAVPRKGPTGQVGSVMEALGPSGGSARRGQGFCWRGCAGWARSFCRGGEKALAGQAVAVEVHEAFGVWGDEGGDMCSRNLQINPCMSECVSMYRL